MAECPTCGRFVSKEFMRVLGNNEDEITNCIKCGGVTGSRVE